MCLQVGGVFLDVPLQFMLQMFAEKYLLLPKMEMAARLHAAVCKKASENRTHAAARLQPRRFYRKNVEQSDSQNWVAPAEKREC